MVSWMPSGLGWNVTSVFFGSWLILDVIILVMVLPMRKLRRLVPLIPGLVIAVDQWLSTNRAEDELAKLRRPK